MSETFKVHPYTMAEPTAQLRLVERDGRRILQQRWKITHYDVQPHRVTGLTGEWRDVPLEEEAEDEKPHPGDSP